MTTGKLACCQGWLPEFHLQDPHDGRRIHACKLPSNLQTCGMVYTFAHVHKDTHAHTCTHQMYTHAIIFARPFLPVRLLANDLTSPCSSFLISRHKDNKRRFLPVSLDNLRREGRYVKTLSQSLANTQTLHMDGLLLEKGSTSSLPSHPHQSSAYAFILDEHTIPITVSHFQPTASPEQPSFSWCPRTSGDKKLWNYSAPKCDPQIQISVF